MSNHPSLGRSRRVRLSALVLGIADLAVLLLLIFLYAVTVPRNIGDGGWTDGLVFVLITAVFALAWYATGALAYALIGAGLRRTWRRGGRSGDVSDQPRTPAEEQEAPGRDLRPWS